MNRPRLVTVASAALASALAFYIITRSGLAGTLAGAAVASMISTGTAHWVGGGLDRCSTWWLERRRLTGEDELPMACEETTLVFERDQTELLSSGASQAGGAGAAAVPTPSRSAWRRALPMWGPVVLAVLAIGVSGYALVTGAPLERIIVKERVVGPTTEKVVVQKEYVTVPVPASGPSGQGGRTATTNPPALSLGNTAGLPATSSTTAGTTTTTSPPTTTSVPTTVTSQPSSVNGG